MDDERRGPGWFDDRLLLLVILPNSYTCESVASLSTMRCVSKCQDFLFFRKATCDHLPLFIRCFFVVLLSIAKMMVR